MIRTAFLAALLVGAATPALAQNGPPPSPYAPLQDKPTCTRDELKAATAAYVEAQRKGDISGLPLHDKAHFLQDMANVDRAAGLWNTALPIAHDNLSVGSQIDKDRQRLALLHSGRQYPRQNIAADETAEAGQEPYGRAAGPRPAEVGGGEDLRAVVVGFEGIVRERFQIDPTE